MASSSSLAVTAPLKKHDVFISFRGHDTRSNFTSHLHDALHRSHVQTYIDYRIKKGKDVWEELENAIKESTLFLVVFSEDYTSSVWCLKELVQIMERNENAQDGDVVIPVFYNIDPSHVRNDQIALAEHIKHGGHNRQKWKDALRKAATLSGFHSRAYRTETDLIKGIIKIVLEKLPHKYSNVHRCHFIRDENYSRIESSIKKDPRKVRIIGIWGMGGIGKTTLAAAVFQEFSFQYESCCLFENVTEETKRHGLNYIGNKILSKLLGEDLGIDTLQVLPYVVIRRLKCMKTFIVLDDLNTTKLLKNLFGEKRDWLGDGSRVIVTTRNKDVLSSGVDEIHEFEEMNFQNSLRLFNWNAFHKTYPETGYLELSKRAIGYAKGIPLALEVLGSCLRSKTRGEWDSTLAKLKEVPNETIHRVLRWSYDELDNKEKNIFLDIACFFKGDERDKVTKILNGCGFYADIGIRNLLDKALIRVSLENCILMHDLIQEMGREIVCERSPMNPGQRSRLWDPEEVCDVLTNNRGTNVVEAIFLDATKTTNINLSSKAFEKMPNLRLLAFRDHKRSKFVHLPSGLDSLPKNLRCILWDGYPLKSLPSSFCAEMLVELSLPGSNVVKLWDGVQNFANLEILDLSDSCRLTRCPNLSGSPNMKSLDLMSCEKLLLLDPSIFSLQKLEYLDVSYCEALERLCSNACPPSLEFLDVIGCSNLQEFSVPLMPNIASTNSLWLSLGFWGLNELPSSVLQLRNLERFCFPISDNLMDLPENFAETIVLYDPEENEWDPCITLRKILPSPAFLSARELIFEGCVRVYEIPENISFLSSLNTLVLLDAAIISLPKTIKHLSQLRRLDVIECKMLQSIPAIPPFIHWFRVWNCKSLQTVSSSTTESYVKSKRAFLLLNCIKLDPHSFDNILKEAIVRSERRARLLLTISESEEDASLDHDDDNDNDEASLDHDDNDNDDAQYGVSYDIWHLPVTSGKVRDWFHYHSTQALVSIELPPNLLGFIYYLVLSQGSIGYGRGIGCECHMETSSGERINITSFGRDNSNYGLWFGIDTGSSSSDDMILSDHVLLWYDTRSCKQIMEAVEESRKAINDVTVRSTSYNQKLTFRFFVETQYDEEVAIKECGFRWIYPSEYQIVVEEEGRFKPKRSRENSAVQNSAEGFESDEQEETKDLRCLLEELLHIGFGGDLMNEEMKMATDEACIWYIMSETPGSCAPPRVRAARKIFPGNRTDIGWKHGMDIQGNGEKVKCNYCSKIICGGIFRFKHHLAGTREDSEPCITVSEEVKMLMLKTVAEAKEASMKKRRLIDIEEENGDEIEIDNSLQKARLVAKGKGKISSTGIQSTINQMLKKPLKEEADEQVAEFFYTSAIPFNCIKNPAFAKMCETIGRYGTGYKPPSYHDIREKILKKAVAQTNVSLEEFREEWKRTGCSIMSDGWTDKKRRSICNFLVNSTKGTVFLYSLDTSDISKTTDKVVKMLDDAINFVGQENVVQVVTDNAANFKAAGEKLMETRKNLYWTPCAAHSIDLIFEDFERYVKIHQDTIKKGRKITTYIYSRTMLISMLKKFTNGKDLVRPAMTRFATAYLTLACLKELKASLMSMFSSDEWKNNRCAATRDGIQVENTVLDNQFWNDAVICLKAAAPLIEVLRLVDSDEKPAMGFIYENMDNAKQMIKTNFRNAKTKYEPIWKLIDERWDHTLRRPLHAAAYWLNPQLHFEPNFKMDDENVKQGVFSCLSRLVSDDALRYKINLQLKDFHLRKGLFGSEFAKKSRKNMQLAEWWEMYGDSTPELKKFAIRILSLTCSSSGCERNWSAFEMVHTKRRNRLHQKKMNDLVYVMYNLKLKKKQIRKSVAIPIDDISSDDEWITEEGDIADVDEEGDVADVKVGISNNPTSHNGNDEEEALSSGAEFDVDEDEDDVVGEFNI